MMLPPPGPSSRWPVARSPTGCGCSTRRWRAWRRSRADRRAQPLGLLAASGSLRRPRALRLGPRTAGAPSSCATCSVQPTSTSSGDRDLPYLDFPLNGVLLAAVGAWACVRRLRDVASDGVRLLAIADRWAYNRSFPTMAWAACGSSPTRQPRPPRRAAPAYADRPVAELVEEARVLLRGRATSSG